MSTNDYDTCTISRAQLSEICERADATEGIPLDRLREMCAAERDGRVVVLPCKVGDTVYIRRYSLAEKRNVIIEARVAAVKVFRTGFRIDAVTRGSAVNKCEWERQCFATREAAEAALKGASSD